MHMGYHWVLLGSYNAVHVVLIRQVYGMLLSFHAHTKKCSGLGKFPILCAPAGIAMWRESVFIFYFIVWQTYYCFCWILWHTRCVSWLKKSLRMVSSECFAVMLLGSLQLYLLAQRTALLMVPIILYVILSWIWIMRLIHSYFLFSQCGKHWSNCTCHWGSNSNIWWGWYKCSNWSDDCTSKFPFIFIEESKELRQFEHKHCEIPRTKYAI